MNVEFDFTCILSGARFVRVCSFFDMWQLLQFMGRNAAASAIHLEKCCGFSGGMSCNDVHLLNSLPRGNLVDGVPRAASVTVE